MTEHGDALSTWQLLQMAREARDIGRPIEAQQLMDQCQPDFEYVRETSVRTAKSQQVRGWSYEDEYLRATVAEQARSLAGVQWLEWQRTWSDRRNAVNLTTMDAILKRVYQLDGIENLNRSFRFDWLHPRDGYMERAARGEGNAVLYQSDPDVD